MEGIVLSGDSTGRSEGDGNEISGVYILHVHVTSITSVKFNVHLTFRLARQENFHATLTFQLITQRCVHVLFGALKKGSVMLRYMSHASKRFTERVTSNTAFHRHV